MSDDQQVQWAPIPPKPASRGRIWLIVGLVVAAVVIVGVLLFLLIPRGETTEPDASASPSPSPSGSSTATLTPTTEPEPEPTTPVATAPPAPDPSIDTFRDRVGVWLYSAPTGLDIVSESSGGEALSVIETLQADAQRLTESVPPASIEAAWSEAAASYAESLDELRSAVESATGIGPAVESARSSVSELRGIAGL